MLPRCHRCVLYGLAAYGGDGAFDALSILIEEIDRTLAQIGCPDASLLSKAFILND
jgi:(S)-mandelate dehydrogenase